MAQSERAHHKEVQLDRQPCRNCAQGISNRVRLFDIAMATTQGNLAPRKSLVINAFVEMCESVVWIAPNPSRRIRSACLCTPTTRQWSPVAWTVETL